MLAYTCCVCHRAISDAEAGGMNPDTGDPICRRCVVLRNGGDPDYKARQLREKIDSIKRRRLPHARMELGKAEGSKITTWQREIQRLEELLADCERKLIGLEITSKNDYHSEI